MKNLLALFIYTAIMYSLIYTGVLSYLNKNVMEYPTLYIFWFVIILYWVSIVCNKFNTTNAVTSYIMAGVLVSPGLISTSLLFDASCNTNTVVSKIAVFLFAIQTGYTTIVFIKKFKESSK